MKRKKVRKKLSRFESILLLIMVVVTSSVCSFFIGYLHTSFGTDAGLTKEKETKLPLDLERLRKMAYQVWYNEDEVRKDTDRVDLHTRILERILAHYPDDYEAHLYLGTDYALYVDPPDLDHAEFHCRNALALRETAMAKCNLGVVMKLKGNYAEAEALFHESIEIDPGCHKAHYNYAVLLRKTGRFSAAVSVCGKLLEMKPDHEKAKKQIKLCEKELEKLDPYSAQ